MSKLTSYIKTFFMLDDSVAYEAQDYRDYTGPGFTKYKKSAYFRPYGLKHSGYTKAEVAAYSEMTKLALLVGCGIVLWVIAALDYWAFKSFIIDHNFRDLVVFAGYFGVLPLNYFAVGIFPRAIFLIKNFKDANGE